MGRPKKVVENPEIETVTVSDENVEEKTVVENETLVVYENSEVIAEEPIEEKETVKVKTEKDIENEQISDNVLAILKLYSEYKELYVSNDGGTFTSPYGKAKLYKNPYYNNQ